jgi:hypothetical protein
LSHSDFLFAQPSFLTGAGRIGDLFGALRHFSYNPSVTPEQADKTAIAEDWRQVGDDLGEAMVTVGKQDR